LLESCKYIDHPQLLSDNNIMSIVIIMIVIKAGIDFSQLLLSVASIGLVTASIEHLTILRLWAQDF